MQRHRNHSRTATQRLPHYHRFQKTSNISRQIRLPLQQQHRLAQRTFIPPCRPRSHERQLLTPAAPHAIRHPALQTDPFFIRENPCFLPTRLTRNSESSLLDTSSADYTDLRVREREDRIVDQFTN